MRKGACNVNLVMTSTLLLREASDHVQVVGLMKQSTDSSFHCQELTDDTWS